MPSPKAFLRDVADFKLDPKVAHTKAGADGRCHGKPKGKPVKKPAVLEPEKVEPTVSEAPEAPTDSKKEPSAPANYGRSKNHKKAANANDSVESPAGKQEATEDSDPAKVVELDTADGV